MKKALLSYLHRYISRLFLVNGSFNSELKGRVMERLLSCFISESLDHQAKLDIVSTVSVACINDQGVHNYGAKLIGHANLALKDRRLMVADYLLYAVVLGQKDLNTVVAVYKACFSTIIELLEGHAQALGTMLKQFEETGHKPGDFQSTKETIEFTLKVMVAEVRLLDFDKFKMTCAELVKNARLFELLRKILDLKPTGYNSVIFTTGNLDVDSLNHLRILALESLNLILKGIREKRYRLDTIPHVRSLYEWLICWCVAELPPSIQSLKSANHRLLELYLSVLSLGARHFEFHEAFARYKRILFGAILDLFLLGSDVQLLSRDPEEYLRALEDLCDRQDINSPKSAAVRLLEAMCDRVDGVLTMVCRKAFVLVEIGIYGTQTNLYLQNDEIDQPILNSALFANSSFADKAKAGLDILAVVSYVADKRNDITNTLEQTIKRHLEFFTTNLTNPLVTISFMNCHAYYADSIFCSGKEIDPTLKAIIDFLLHLICLEGDDGLATGLRLTAL